MKEELVNSLISKQQKGQCSHEEQKMLNDWRTQSLQNQTHYDEIAKIEQALQDFPFDLNPDTDQEWTRLKNRLNLTSQTIQKEAKVVPLRSRFGYLIRVAAAVILVAGLGWFVAQQFSTNQPSWTQEYTIPSGQMEQVTLPDGSLVHLNADSKLWVADDFNQNNRTLKLEGEAYFEVTKNTELPFIIQTGKVKTEVVGTAFNLKAYPEDAQVSLTVEEGKVKFESPKQSVGVTANHAVAFDKSSKKINQITFQPDISTSWKQGRIIFKDTPLAEALKVMERRFGITFIDRSGIEKITLQVEQEDSLDKTLEALEWMLQVNIERSADTVRLKK